MMTSVNTAIITPIMSLYSKIQEWQTRLAVVKLNTDHNAQLEINLQVVDLVDVPTGAVINHETLIMYDALSYAWGNEPASIACTCDGTELLLRANLASALKYLRHRDRDRYIWADFICINQDDDIEKSFQIPRMRSIYSKASGVFIWLGEAPAVEHVLQDCNEQCGLSCAGALACPKHNDDLWRQILEYSWFRRTWVRQEVHAARILQVCFPHFSVPWGTFIQSFESLDRQDPDNKTTAEMNIMSLNETYNELRKPQTIEPVRRLLNLLKQGVWFQATVPHDHIFSILGMMLMPKTGTRRIPVDYHKPYEEVCSDAVRFIIRETQNLHILKLCVFQKNKTYAFDWPTISWSSRFEYDPRQTFILPRRRINTPVRIASLNMDLFYQHSGPPIEWFDLENPIRDAGTSTPLESTNSILMSNQTVLFIPVVLHGRVWGTLTWSPHDTVYYIIDETDDVEEEVEPSPGHVNKLYEIFVTGTAVISSPDGSERKKVIVANFYGGRGGDLLVRLQPGAMDFILRKCRGIDDLFEIVGYSDRGVHTLSRNDSQPFPPGPDKRFRIR